MRTITAIVRAAGDPHFLVRQIERSVAAIDRSLAVDNAVLMQHQLDEFTSERRFNTLLTSIFAALALALALAGTYAVLSNLVAARTREWGIRSALGATPQAVRKVALIEALWPVAAGALGVCGTYVLGRYVENLLFGVKAHDPGALMISVAAVLAAAAAASWIPAQRAARVDPNVALREE